MKKIIFLLGILPLAFISCDKNESVSNVIKDEPSKMIMLTDIGSQQISVSFTDNNKSYVYSNFSTGDSGLVGYKTMITDVSGYTYYLEDMRTFVDTNSTSTLISKNGNVFEFVDDSLGLNYSLTVDVAQNQLTIIGEQRSILISNIDVSELILTLNNVSIGNSVNIAAGLPWKQIYEAAKVLAAIVTEICLESQETETNSLKSKGCTDNSTTFCGAKCNQGNHTP